jgi:regulator of cell morphogenesis and NO signaling
VLPFLNQLTHKLATDHGEQNPRLVELQLEFQKLEDVLVTHMDQEERVLFPALASHSPDPGLVRQGFELMRAEHGALSATLEKMRVLTEGFVASEGGCRSERILMKELEALEEDVLRHLRLEGQELMPRFAQA